MTSAVSAPRSVPVLIPGWGGSGPEHWQTLWQARLPQVRRVEMPDWLTPEPTSWVAALDDVVSEVVSVDRRAPFLIAHSLGCVAVARWAGERSRPVAGALLVAPPDLERPDAPPELRSFSPVPRHRLPFPTVVVASTDDPYASLEYSAALAAGWGAALEVLPGAGHINAASGHGAWPEGWQRLHRLAGW